VTKSVKPIRIYLPKKIETDVVPKRLEFSRLRTVFLKFKRKLTGLTVNMEEAGPAT
jgi:hypothetical protein